MNDLCNRTCAYKEVCNLDRYNTDLCKVAYDKQAQDFRNTHIIGYEIDALMKKQQKK